MGDVRRHAACCGEQKLRSAPAGEAGVRRVRLPNTIDPDGLTWKSSGRSSTGDETGLWRLPGDFLQHVYGGVELSVKIAAQNIEDLDQGTIADRIVNLIAHFPAHHDLFGPEDCQMLRGVGLLDAEFFHQLSGRQLALAQEFYHGDPRWICESLKNLTLELS